MQKKETQLWKLKRWIERLNQCKDGENRLRKTECNWPRKSWTLRTLMWWMSRFDPRLLWCIPPFDVCLALMQISLWCMSLFYLCLVFIYVSFWCMSRFDACLALTHVSFWCMPRFDTCLTFDENTSIIRSTTRGNTIMYLWAKMQLSMKKSGKKSVKDKIEQGQSK